MIQWTPPTLTPEPKLPLQEVLSLLVHNCSMSRFVVAREEHFEDVIDHLEDTIKECGSFGKFEPD